MDKEDVHLFSKHYKDCPNEETKKLARLLLNGLIDYDKEHKCYVVDNQTIKWKNKRLTCSCGKEDCEHILALFLQFKLWNYEKQKIIKVNAFETI